MTQLWQSLKAYQDKVQMAALSILCLSGRIRRFLPSPTSTFQNKSSQKKVSGGIWGKDLEEGPMVHVWDFAEAELFSDTSMKGCQAFAGSQSPFFCPFPSFVVSNSLSRSSVFCSAFYPFPFCKVLDSSLFFSFFLFALISQTQYA